MRIGLSEAGWALLVLAVLMLCVGFYAELNLLYLLASTIIALVFLSVPLSFISIRGLDMERHRAEEVFAHTPCRIEVRLIRKRRRWLMFGRVSIEETYRGPSGSTPAFCFFDHVPREGYLRGTYSVALPRRGEYTIERPWISSGFPFGLAYTRRRLTLEETFIAYPRLGRLQRPVEAPGKPGELHRRQATRGFTEGEFRSLREYQPGDNPHLIHWRVSAKRGKLHLRELEFPSGSRRVTLILDTTLPKKAKTEDIERVENAVSFAATLALHFCRLGRTVALLTAEGEAPTTHSRRALLERLALAESPETSAELIHAVEESARDHSLSPAVVIAHDRATTSTVLERLPASGVRSFLTDGESLDRTFAMAPAEGVAP